MLKGKIHLIARIIGFSVQHLLSLTPDTFSSLQHVVGKTR
jgi:hypothetical protein